MSNLTFEKLEILRKTTQLKRTHLKTNMKGIGIYSNEKDVMVSWEETV